MRQIRLDELGISKDHFIREDGAIFSTKSGAQYRLSVFIGTIGYAVVGLKIEGKTQVHTMHRLMAKAFIPNPQEKPQVNHLDGVKSNYTLSNLEWCTDRENKLHGYRLGLMNISERRRAASSRNMRLAHAKNRLFDDATEIEIAERLRSGQSIHSIARSLGCTDAPIARIKKQHVLTDRKAA